MPAEAVALALFAALFHAGWNLVLGSARDVRAATTAALALSVLFLAPWAAATWEVERAALPWIAASAALELAYFGLLVAVYSRSDVSLVYPIARGSAPVLVLGGGFALGASVGFGPAVGVLLVAVGVVLVRGLGHGVDRVGAALGLLVGVTISGYTLVDNEGIEHAAVPAYLELVLAPVALAALVFEASSGRLRAVRGALGPSTVAAGIASFLAYALVLRALELAAAAPVAAVRESSILVVAFVGAAFLGEGGGGRRVLGAALVAAGVALVGVA